MKCWKHQDSAKVTQAVLDELKRLQKRIMKIMATQAELAKQLQDVATQLAAGNEELGKVRGETAALQQTVKDLQDALANQTAPSQELQDAVAAVVTQSGVVIDGIKKADDLVPDAVTPPPTP